MSPIEVRAPVPSEHAAIRDLLVANGWEHRVGDAAWFESLLAGSLCVVAVESGGIVGFARAVTDGLSNGYLSMVVVEQAHRGQGIGTRLVREVMGSDPGISWVLRASRPGARAFFEKLGFAASSDAMERNRAARRPAAMRLVQPTHEHLASYVAALERGWSPNNERPAAAAEELACIRSDPDAFLASMDDRAGGGPPVMLPDGTQVPRLPGFRLWLWDGEFVGNIGLRWQPGTTALPPYCLGHVGYSVVPWKQGRGYGKQALRALLQEARGLGLPYLEITTDAHNPASQRVIESAGGVLHERFDKPPQFGGGPALRYRVPCA